MLRRQAIYSEGRYRAVGDEVTCGSVDPARQPARLGTRARGTHGLPPPDPGVAVVTQLALRR
jgi:hypothetical protein